MMVALLVAAIALGMLGMIRKMGFDLGEFLINIYPFDLTQSPRSLFNKRAGITVFFIAPLSIIFCVIYSRHRADSAIERYESLDLRVSGALGAAYFILFVYVEGAIAIFSYFNWPILGLVCQFVYLGFFSLCIEKLVVRKFSSPKSAIEQVAQKPMKAEKQKQHRHDK